MEWKSIFNGPSLTLSAPRAEDALIMARWTTDDEYLRLVDTDIARPKSVAHVEQNPVPDYEFRLRRLDDDALVGFVALFGLEWGNRMAKMAIGIGDARFRGHGYGSEGMRLILNYAFWELNLHRVGLDVITYNQRAIALYEKMGFQEEGRIREAVCRQGQHFDLLLMGILDREWGSV